MGMAEITDEDDLFQKLTDAQMAQLAPFGQERRAQAGEVIFDQGDSAHGVFVVLEGSLEIAGVANSVESIVRVLERGDFTGEVNQLSGRRSLVRCRAREDSVLLEIGRAKLHEIMQTDVTLGEIFL